MLQLFRDEIIRETQVLLDGQRFVRCTFIDCELVYEGQDDAAFEACSFENCSWTLSGPAARTLSFLSNLSQEGGTQGDSLVAAIAQNVRDGRFAELRPDYPSTSQSATKVATALAS